MEINDIVKAISIKLHQVFGDSYTIYAEKIPQGFTRPCFFIALLEPEMQQIMGNRYKLTLLFDIHYFGPNNMDSYSTLSKLMTDMEYISTINGDMVRGTKMNGQLVDDVLHFFVHYDLFLMKQELKVFMETIERHSANLKG